MSPSPGVTLQAWAWDSVFGVKNSSLFFPLLLGFVLSSFFSVQRFLLIHDDCPIAFGPVPRFSAEYLPVLWRTLECLRGCFFFFLLTQSLVTCG